MKHLAVTHRDPDGEDKYMADEPKGGANERKTIPSSAPQRDTKGTSQRTPDKAGDSAPVQSDASLAAALQERGIPAGGSTASGLAASPETYEKPKDTARTDGETPSRDKNSPAQEPGTATFLNSGQLEHGTVPSNTGPIPAAATGSDDATLHNAHAESVKAQQKQLYTPLTREQVTRMGNAEVRAHAGDRGYNIGEAGTRVLRERFLDAQEKDTRFTGEPTTAAPTTTTNVGGVVSTAPAPASAPAPTAPAAAPQSNTGTSAPTTPPKK
jgi:hypothetical protein